MAETSIYECTAQIVTDGGAKLSKYKSTKSGMTICIGETGGPLVGGYLCVGEYLFYVYRFVFHSGLLKFCCLIQNKRVSDF